MTPRVCLCPPSGTFPNHVLHRPRAACRAFIWECRAETGEVLAAHPREHHVPYARLCLKQVCLPG